MHDQKSYLILFINTTLVISIVQEPMGDGYLRPYYLFYDGGPYKTETSPFSRRFHQGYLIES